MKRAVIRSLALAIALFVLVGAAGFIPLGGTALAAKSPANVERIESPSKAMPVSDAITFKVITSKNAKYLYMSQSRGERLKTWKASKYSVYELGSKIRIWTVSYKFKDAGTYNLVFGASADGSIIGLTRKVTVWLKDKDPEVTSITLNVTGTQKLNVGKSLTLKATVKPSNAKGKLKWESSDEKIATVSSSGKVKALKQGAARITVTSENGKKASVKIKVTKAKTPATTPTPPPSVPAGSTELTTYLGEVIDDVARSMGLKADAVWYDKYTGSYNIGWTGDYSMEKTVEYGLSANPPSRRVRALWLTETGTSKDGKYSLFGVRVGMDAKAAVAAMKSNGLEQFSHNENRGSYQFKYPQDLQTTDGVYVFMEVSKTTGKVIWLSTSDPTIY